MFLQGSSWNQFPQFLPYGCFHSHGGPPKIIHFNGIFHEINNPSIGPPAMTMETPMDWTSQASSLAGWSWSEAGLSPQAFNARGLVKIGWWRWDVSETTVGWWVHGNRMNHPQSYPKFIAWNLQISFNSNWSFKCILFTSKWTFNLQIFTFTSIVINWSFLSLGFKKSRRVMLHDLLTSHS